MSESNTEREFKDIMERAGWKVIKTHHDTALNSPSLSDADLNFIEAVKIFFGEIGLPDFLVISPNSVGFVEVKYRGQLTKEQKDKLSLLRTFLGMWCYVVRKG